MARLRDAGAGEQEPTGADADHPRVVGRPGRHELQIPVFQGHPALGSTTSPPTRQAVEVSFICVKSRRGISHGVGDSNLPAKFESKLALVSEFGQQVLPVVHEQRRPERGTAHVAGAHRVAELLALRLDVGGQRAVDPDDTDPHPALQAAELDGVRRPPGRSGENTMAPAKRRKRNAGRVVGLELGQAGVADRVNGGTGEQCRRQRGRRTRPDPREDRGSRGRRSLSTPPLRHRGG